MYLLLLQQIDSFVLVIDPFVGEDWKKHIFSKPYKSIKQLKTKTSPILTLQEELLRK